jgi:hypothetical protein
MKEVPYFIEFSMVGGSVVPRFVSRLRSRFGPGRSAAPQPSGV